MNKTLLTTLCIAVIGGCTLAPKYHRPEAPVSSQWPGSPSERSPGADPSASDIGWREFYSDPRLLRLVELGLTNNRDLRVAALNVEQTRAQFRIEQSFLFPSVEAVARGTRQHIPADQTGQGRGITAGLYSVGLGVTAYEVDLFGRVRSLRAQALERYLATAEARRSAQIALISEIAVQYLIQRSLDEQLAVTRQTLESLDANYHLIEQSFKIGNSSELDVRSAESQVQSARADVAALVRQIAQAENALVLLVGQPMPTNLPPPRPLQAQDLLADLPPGLPSDLLQRRPDILAAEHQLQAAHANIGAARAAFFPRILLTGFAGRSSIELWDLMDGGAGAWSFSPQITLPIFEGGRNKAELDAAKLGRLIEIAQYERAIQAAFREVADALAARDTLDQQIEAEELLVNAEQKRFTLAEARYRSGVENYLSVLSAQRDLYVAQRRLIQSQFSRLANRVDLYRALGGGWHEKTLQPTQQTAKSPS